MSTTIKAACNLITQVLITHLLCRNSSSRDRSDRDRGYRDWDRFDRFDSRREDRGLDRPRQAITKCSFSRENDERRSDSRGPPDSVRRVSSMTDNHDRGSRERDRSKETGKS